MGSFRAHSVSFSQWCTLQGTYRLYLNQIRNQFQNVTFGRRRGGVQIGQNFALESLKSSIMSHD